LRFLFFLSYIAGVGGAEKKLPRGGLGTWKGEKPKGASRPVVVKGKPVGDVVLEERPSCLSRDFEQTGGRKYYVSLF
jgi:hypothetical protein